MYFNLFVRWKHECVIESPGGQGRQGHKKPLAMPWLQRTSELHEAVGGGGEAG